MAAASVFAATAGVARADDASAARAILRANIETLVMEQSLARCAAKSPTRNTPCIVHAATTLATLDARHIGLIQAAAKDSTMPCVKKVAAAVVQAMGVERRAALAVVANHRKQARGLFLRSDSLNQANAKLEESCLPRAAGG